LGIRLGADETRVPVACRAANAWTLLRLSLIQHDAEWHVERPQALAYEIVGELLDARLVGDGWVRIRRARKWLSRIGAAVAVDVIETLSAGVVGLEIVVCDGPRRRYAVGVFELSKVFAPHPEQRGAVKLRVAADPVVGVGVQLAARGIAPDFL